MSNITRINRRNGKRYIYLFLFIVGLVFSLYLLLQMSKIEDVDIEGNYRYSDQEVLRAINIYEGDDFIDVFVDKKYNERGMLYIEDVDIQYTGVHHILVSVKEKDIIGYIPYMDKYLCIDYEGYIIDYTDEIYENIPIIEGVHIESFNISEKLEVEYETIDTFIMFYHVKEKYNFEIDYIQMDPQNEKEIMLNIGEIQVLFGGKDRFDDKIEILDKILKEISGNERGILDLRGDLHQVILK